MIKKSVQHLLRILAERIVKKYAPKVIGITGSVGKTSTKEAIAVVLGGKFRVRKNIKNYNNEIGVPLTIIGSESGNKNFLKWFGIFLKALSLIFVRDKKYPEILVLEMGADRPRDIQYLVRIVPPDIGVITAIGAIPVHVEFFRSAEHLAREKSFLIRRLKPHGSAVLNRDDERVWDMRHKTKGNVLSFGFHEEAHVRASDISVLYPREGENDRPMKEQVGVNFKLHYQGNVVPLFLPSVVGTHEVQDATAAAAVGIACGMNLVDIGRQLQSFVAPKGRMNLLKGVKHTWLIDDTYNSAPLSCEMALRALAQFPTRGRRIAALGDMAELGMHAEEAHRSIGQKAAQLRIDILVCVGTYARVVTDAAIASGVSSEQVLLFATAKEAGPKIQELLRKGDVVLVKGSQSARMEHVTKELMAEPLRASELLVRQEPAWFKKP